MDIFNLLAILVSLAAVFAWANHRYLHLPATIGIMVISILFSLALVVLGALGVGGSGFLTRALEGVDFSEALLHGMLGALLFAGALHLNLDDLRERKLVISILATGGVLISTGVVGAGAYLIFRAVGLELSPAYCFLFGALISPTDPIAVGSILRKAGVPDSLLVKITGESLFNDGVGVVLFILILELVGTEVGGGLVFGGAVGWIVYRMLAQVDHYQVEILLTLAIVTGGYALAQTLHISGPLAMVVAGLLIGNQGRSFAMTPEVVEHLDSFWELVDEFLNAVLFVMIGLEILLINFDPRILAAGLGTVLLVVLARWISVGIPVSILRPFRTFSPHTVKILTWSGLRGGISVALALSLPPGPARDVVVPVTYTVVVFSIVAQGLTVGPVARRLTARG